MQDQICDQGMEAVRVDGCDRASRETDPQVAEQAYSHGCILRSLRCPCRCRGSYMKPRISRLLSAAPPAGVKISFDLSVYPFRSSLAGIPAATAAVRSA